MKNRPRTGVYLCSCRETINKKVEYETLSKLVKESIPEVKHLRYSQNLCAFLEGELITREINKYQLERVLVVGCSEAKRENFFKNAITKAGLPASFLQMVNLREECSSVHTKASLIFDKSLKKILDGINRLSNAEQCSLKTVQVNRRVLIIGGGFAGLKTALFLAQLDFKVLLVEREAGLGGVLGKIHSLMGSTNKPLQLIKEMISRVKANSNIDVLTSTEVIDLEGNIGNFRAYLESEGREIFVGAGAIIVATGLQTIFCPIKYGLNTADNILGLIKLEQHLAEGRDFSGKRVSVVLGKTNENHNLLSVTALKNALYLRTIHNCEVNFFYENMKVAGDGWEELYNNASKAGIRFLRVDKKLEICAENGHIIIKYKDPFLRNRANGSFRLASDFVVFPDEIVPPEGTDDLANVLGINLGYDCFLGSKNMHLLTEFTNREGIYLTGSCQGPAMLPDIRLQSRNVAGEIAKKLGGSHYKEVESLGLPTVDYSKCVVCLTCYRSCPHRAITIEQGEHFDNLYKASAQVNPLACKRCGLCTGECPARALQLSGFTDLDILTQLSALGG